LVLESPYIARTRHQANWIAINLKNAKSAIQKSAGKIISFTANPIRFLTRTQIGAAVQARRPSNKKKQEVSGRESSRAEMAYKGIGALTPAGSALPPAHGFHNRMERFLDQN